MRLDDLAARIHRARPCRIGGQPALRGCCPSHDDRNPSFYAWESEDGWLHLRCPKCSEAEIFAALGITSADCRLHERSDPEPETRYVYRDAEGRNLLCKIRRNLPGGGKVFRIEGWRNGQWVKGIRHLNEQRFTLYNLPAVQKAIAEGRTIYLNEGEKACDAMARKGMVGACQPFGADANPGSRWTERHTLLLQGANVAVVADRDAVGEAYAQYVARQISGVARRVRVVQSRTEGAKDDAYDHLARGFGEDDWVERRDLMPRRGLPTVNFDPATFQPVQLDFLLEPYLPKGKCVLLDADGGTGKTSLMVAMAAYFSNGLTPVSGEPSRPVRTLYLHKGEDQNDELGTVFHANGGNLREIAFYQGALALDGAGVRQVEETVADGRFELVVFDALFYFLSGVVEDTGVALDVMGVMERLNGLAERTGCTVVNIRHTTKGSVGKQASELGMGSVQFRNSHRGQLVARWHPTERGLVVVTDEKGSLLVPRGPHFCYRREGLEVQFVHGVTNPFEADAARRPKLDIAKAFLIETLKGRYMESQRVLDLAVERGICQRTLREARTALGVKSVRNGAGYWLAHLPE